MDDQTRPEPPLHDKASSSPRASSATGGEERLPLADSATLQAPSADTQAVAASTTLSAPGTNEQPAAPAGEQPASATGDTQAATPARSAGGTHERLLGQTLAERYTLISLLGRGGMSVVFRARHELLQKQVAVKLLNEQLAGSKESLSRFHREAMAAANIGDPHIVDVTDYGFTGEGHAFLVMELLEGQSLRQLLDCEGALPAGRAVAIARQILRALHAAHQRGIIHRDLKAENIFLCQRDGRDFVKLLDFGISKVLVPPEGAASGTLTGIGVVIGTPQYIAPEQAHADRSMDHRVDIYSLGVILYEMLTGSLPFSGKSPLEVMMKHVQEAPQPPRERRPELAIPLELEQLVLKALSKEPQLRYGSAAEMLAALPEALSLPGGFSSVTTLTSLPPARRSRRPYLLGGIGGAVLTVIGLILWGIFGGDPPEEPTDIGATPPLSPTAIVSVPNASVPDAAAADSAPPDLLAATILLEVTTSPRGATIQLAGKTLGRGAAQTELPRSKAPLELLVRAPGYQPQTVTITPDRSQRIHLELRPARRSPPQRPAPGKKPPAQQTPQEIRDNPYPTP